MIFLRGHITNNFVCVVGLSPTYNFLFSWRLNGVKIGIGGITVDLKYEKARNEKLYAVGYDETNHRYLLLIVFPEIV